MRARSNEKESPSPLPVSLSLAWSGGRRQYLVVGNYDVLPHEDNRWDVELVEPQTEGVYVALVVFGTGREECP